jgi:hypothetical protein
MSIEGRAGYQQGVKSGGAVELVADTGLRAFDSFRSLILSRTALVSYTNWGLRLTSIILASFTSGRSTLSGNRLNISRSIEPASC